MPVLTLTTDFGHKDYSVSAFKARLLSELPGLVIVDISHGVSPYSIEEAAYIFGSVYNQFPAGTIHVISVFDIYSERNRLLFFRRDGQSFIGPDNGLFSLVFDDFNEGNVFCKEFSLKDRFPIQNTYVELVKRLDREEPLEEIGAKAGEIVKKLNLHPVVSKNELRGSIIYIDHFGNAVINIDMDLFERTRAGRKFQLFFKRFDPITSISSHYMDGEIGEPVCTFNSRGLLEIAVTLGRANELLGLRKGDAIQIEFKP